jgi:DNA-binding SARP family transcriptional activator
LEEAGHIEVAAELLASSQDWINLGVLLARHADSLLDDGRIDTLEDWILAIPENVRMANGWLLYHLGRCQFWSGSPRARTSFARAHDAFVAARDGEGALLAAAHVVDCAVAEGAGDIADLFIAVVEKLWEENDSALSEAAQIELMRCSHALLLRKPLHSLLPALAERAEVCARTLRVGNHRLVAGAFAIHYLLGKGSIVLAKALATELGGREHEAAAPARVPFLLWKAVILRHEAEHAAAAQTLGVALELARASAVLAPLPCLYAELAEIALQQADVDAATRALDAGAPLVREPSVETLRFRFLRAAVLQLRGQLAPAVLTAEEAVRAHDREKGSPQYQAAVRGMLGQLLALRGDFARAREELAHTLAFARDVGNPLLEADALLVLARCDLEEGLEAAGVALLRQALAARAQHDYKGSQLLWLPDVMAQLCAVALESEIELPYIRGLIRERGLKPASVEMQEWPWLVRIYTLGRFAVLVDGRRLTFGHKTPQKPLDLLKALVARGGRGVNQRDIVEQLWPDLDGDASRNAFNLALHRLRKLLRNDAAVVTEDGKLALDPAQVWVDVWSFERLSGVIDRWAPGAVSPQDLEIAMTRLLRSYTGHFLAGEDAAWAIAARERLRSKLLRAVFKMGQLLEQAGLTDDATLLYRRAIELDPLTEEFHRGLIVSFRTQNRIAEAIDAYRRCHDILSRTFGVQPSAPTRAVFQTLK